MNVDVAQSLADHAVLLLGLGIVALGIASGIVIAIVRLLARHRATIAGGVGWILGLLRRIPVFDSMLGRARTMLPSSYVAMHLILGLLATAAIVGFLIIAEEVAVGREVAEFDHAFARALAESATPQWRRFFGVLTDFGSVLAITIATTIVAIFLLFRRQYVLAIGWIMAQAGGGLLVLALKNAFARSRPELAYTSQLASGWSFPSGHSTGTFVLAGMAAYLLFRSTRSWMTTAVVAIAAIGWCLIIGFTRLYLGVHYLSDVVAGLIAATAWVAICVSGIEIGMRRFERQAFTK